MKILYKQNDKNKIGNQLFELGIAQCYLKEIAENRDTRLVTKKEHSHTGYEIHIVSEGGQIYDVGGVEYRVNSGCFLLIPPGTRHKIIKSDSLTRKYSVTFAVRCDSENALSGFEPPPVRRERTDDIIALCRRISDEARLSGGLSHVLIENAVFELVVRILRICGFNEGRRACEVSDENARLELAKKYIKDNIEQNLSVPDVAVYCYISEKQLTRLFRAHDGVSPGEYIRRLRISRIEGFLADKTLSLKEISRIMNFNNEYYFNLFFKKYYGMPPGEYRKTLLEI